MAYKGPVSDHFDGKKFYYPYKKMDKPFSDVLKFLLNRADSMWPEWVDGTAKEIPPQRIYGNTLRVSFVNHSTVLIQTQGKNILTDPVWSERASPFSFTGPKRAHAPGIDFDHLPPIDVVVISHNHYDHLDLDTVKQLYDKFKPTFFVGLGVSENMRSMVPDASIIELDWNQNYLIDGSLTVHFCPCQHWSARGIFDRNETLWGAFVLETPGGNIYFAGDTGYSPHFKQAQEQFGRFRLALMPVGAYEPRWFMEYAHINPEEAVKGFLDLKAAYGLAIHHSCFPLADERRDAPIHALSEALQHYKVPDTRFKVVPPGQGWEVPLLTP